MGKKREHMTIEECKAQVNEEIPYVVGSGTKCVQLRSRRLKELYKRHGHPVDNPMQIGFGFNGGRDVGASSSHRIDVRASTQHGERDINIRFRGQRVA